MTEAEWLASNDLGPILSPQAVKASERKLRQFAVACCRCVWKLLQDSRSRTAVEVAERLADGEATESERLAAYDAALCACRHAPRNLEKEAYAAYYSCHRDAREAAHRSWFKTLYGNHRKWARGPALLHCIFSNPFRPVPVVEPDWLAWRGGTVPRLAAAIYSSRTFRYLPVLADALEEAGCTDATILAHCRSGRKHVRGCWVVDLLLGKE